MKNTGLLLAIVLVLAVVILPGHADAQCAMCRAGVENSLQNGKIQAGAGLNTGILYLMSVPYLLFSILGVLWYRNSKKHKDGKGNSIKRNS